MLFLMNINAVSKMIPIWAGFELSHSKSFSVICFSTSLSRGEEVIFECGVEYFAFLFWGQCFFVCVFVFFVKLN